MQSREMYVYMDKYTWGGKKNLPQIAKTNKPMNKQTKKNQPQNQGHFWYTFTWKLFPCSYSPLEWAYNEDT